jgi:hypothetical protein
MSLSSYASGQATQPATAEAAATAGLASITSLSVWPILPTKFLFVVVTARPGTLSYQHSFVQLPKLILRYFSNNSLMIVFPDQHGETEDNPTFSAPNNHTYSTDSRVNNWLSNWINE